MFLTSEELYTKLNEIDGEGKRLCVIVTNEIQNYVLMRILDSYGIVWMSDTKLLDDVQRMTNRRAIAYYFNKENEGEFKITYSDFSSMDSLQEYKSRDSEVVFIQF